MRGNLVRAHLSIVVSIAAAACGSPARLPVSAGMGFHPVLPPPEEALIPVINVVTRIGWPPDATPMPADGLTVRAFARGLDHPRFVYVLPNGDVLVAETNAPRRPEDGKGIKGFFFKFFQAKAGGGVPSANRITLLRDTDGDGVADIRSAFLTDLRSPFGIALAGDQLYVANTDALVRFPYTNGATHIATPGTTLTKLPGGRLNHHWTKSVIASPDGSKLYVSVGSNSNAGENGVSKERGRAAIWEVDAATGRHRIFASGLRNAVGLAWEPTSGQLWAGVNERDELGSDLVPDYITHVRDGGFYGWPYSYYGKHIDARVHPQRPDLVARAIVPDFAVGSHTASLGLAWSSADGGMFVGQHGSWNRKPRSGYKVIFIPFSHGMPTGEVRDVLTGFVRENGDAMGRPVGVAIDKSGALLVADDIGNVIWRVTRAPSR